MLWTSGLSAFLGQNLGQFPLGGSQDTDPEFGNTDDLQGVVNTLFLARSSLWNIFPDLQLANPSIN